MEPRVSVVVPTFNRANLLVEAVDSVLRQTRTDFEVLVVDDGSTDDTAAVVRKRYAGDARVRYLPKKNGGTADARQHGLDHARGEYLGLLDSDDLYLPRFLESQVAALERDPAAHLVLCDARFEGPWDHADPTIFSQFHWKTPNSCDALADHGWALPATMLMRTEVVRTLGLRSRFSHAEDTDFLWRLNIAGYRLIENRELLSVYRRHDGNSGAPQKIDDRHAFHDDHYRMLKTYYDVVDVSKHMRTKMSRQLAEHLMALGRWREARPYLWTWWKKKPDSSKALRWLLLSFFK